MIRLVRIDLERAVDLLEQHHAAEPVRQRHIGDGELAVRALEDSLAQPQRAADDERNRRRRAVEGTLQERRKLLGGIAFSVNCKANDKIAG